MGRKCPECGANIFLQLNDIIVNTTTYRFAEDGKADPKSKEVSFNVMSNLMHSLFCTECSWGKRPKFTTKEDLTIY